ncbi:MAG: thrombospondin type 3 repeat-containing protein, partial [Myxococcales bacterium]|nr:thrombospondin type 3 repeat-containing protein [Myxococcales bacterium]
IQNESQVGQVQGYVFVSSTVDGLREFIEASDETPLVFLDQGHPLFVAASVPVEGATAEERARTFLADHAAFFGIPDLDAIEVSGHFEAADDQTGDVSVRFEQRTTGGLRVQDAELRVTMRGDAVVWTSGRILRREPTLPEHYIGWAAAQAIAIDAFPGTADDTVGTPQLVYFDPWVASSYEDSPERRGDRAELAWVIRIGGTLDGGAGDIAEFIVGAESRRIHRLRTLTQHNVPQSVWDFEEEQISWRCDEVASPAVLGHPLVCDEDGCASNTNKEAQEIQEFTELFTGWLENYMFFDSYDNQGARIVSMARLAANPPWAAFANPNCDYFGYHVPADIALIGHELAHGVIDHTARLVYENSSGAVNEAIAQVFALFGNRLTGEDQCDVLCANNVVVPNRLSQYCDNPECGVEGDNGGVHRNRAILAHSFELMLNGGQHPAGGPTIEAMSSQKLERLVAATLYIDLTARSGLVETCIALRSRALRWATDETWGFDHDDYCTVAEACAAGGMAGWVADCQAGDDPDGPLVVPVQSPDDDNDGIVNFYDNCPGVAWPSTSDIDGDGDGDACDDDVDGDGIANDEDACPLHVDVEGQPYPPCGDIDGDGFINAEDLCPEDALEERYLDYDFRSLDSDGDGIGDQCDPDPDGDGVAPPDDLCPFLGVVETSDRDGDGVGDACDSCPDDETRGYCLAFVCDADGDGLANSCDDDIDGDGIANGPDNCDYVPNPDQLDQDQDGLGWACDMEELWNRADPDIQIVIPNNSVSPVAQPIAFCSDDCDDLTPGSPIEVALAADEEIEIGAAIINNLGAIEAWFDSHGSSNGIQYLGASFIPGTYDLPSTVQFVLDESAFDPWWVTPTYYILLFPLEALDESSDVVAYVSNEDSEPVCGNGRAELGEVCDGTDTRGVTATCNGLGYIGGGDAPCNSNCDGFILDGCTGCTLQTQCASFNGMDCLATGRCGVCSQADPCYAPEMCSEQRECVLN